MEGNTKGPKARHYVEQLLALGRYTFSMREAQQALGVSADATKLALHRLARQTAIASPARGFYVIVPPEYRALGCLPADQFIPDLMKFLKLRYYVGLLSAAQYHGAAHQRPQVFQVFLPRAHRPIKCGKVQVSFIVRKRLSDVPTQTLDTPRGPLAISTPEATAIDLAGYSGRAAGLSNVGVVIGELAEKIDSEKLATAAATAPVSWSQRLGYLLELSGGSDRAIALHDYVSRNARKFVSLSPRSTSQGQKNSRWKLLVNTEVEIDT